MIHLLPDPAEVVDVAIRHGCALYWYRWSCYIDDLGGVRGSQIDHATVEASKVDGYASALLEIARAEGSDADLANEMYTAANALAGNAELIEVLRDPAVPTERKQGIVNDLLGAGALALSPFASMSFLVGLRPGPQPR